MNISSCRNKSASIQELIKSTFDIFLISETTINDSFANVQFKIEGYKSFRKDQDSFGGGLTQNKSSLIKYMLECISF